MHKPWVQLILFLCVYNIVHSKQIIWSFPSKWSVLWRWCFAVLRGICLCMPVCVYVCVMIYCSSKQWQYCEVQWDYKGTHSFVNLNGFMHHALWEPADQSIKEWHTLPRGVFNGTAGVQISRDLIPCIWINAWLFFSYISLCIWLYEAAVHTKILFIHWDFFT